MRWAVTWHYGLGREGGAYTSRDSVGRSCNLKLSLLRHRLLIWMRVLSSFLSVVCFTVPVLRFNVHRVLLGFLLKLEPWFSPLPITPMWIIAEGEGKCERHKETRHQFQFLGGAEECLRISGAGWGMTGEEGRTFWRIRDFRPSLRSRWELCSSGLSRSVSGYSSPTFRDNLSVPYSRVKNPFSERFYHYPLRKNPEERSSHPWGKKRHLRIWKRSMWRCLS
jgi:hypothetical protein